jgi:hypothetical protein
MKVVYHVRAGVRVPDYLCDGRTVDDPQPVCQWISGGQIDNAVSQLLLEIMTPVAIEVSLAVQQEVQTRLDEVDRLRQQQVERARYEADLAQGRYKVATCVLTRYVFLLKMCSQIDKPLRFQEISHIEEHITLPPRSQFLFHRGASAFGDRNVIALALMANFPPFRLPFFLFGDSDLLSYTFEQRTVNWRRLAPNYVVFVSRRRLIPKELYYPMQHFSQEHIKGQMLLTTFDPDHRLVADTLEADWNHKLRAFEQAQREYEQHRQQDRVAIDEELRTRLQMLTANFQSLWRDPDTPDRERKRLVRLLVEDVTLIKREQLWIHVRFPGGATKTIQLPFPRRITSPRCCFRSGSIAG